MSTQILPTNQPIYYCVSNPSVLLTGMTHVGELTGVAPNFDVIADADPLAFVAALPGERFEPLPESGWLEQGALYRCGDEVVLVRQSHFRTEHHPADVPALFIVWREDAPGLDWIAGEQVYGTRFVCAEYECLQARDASDWPPPMSRRYGGRSLSQAPNGKRARPTRWATACSTRACSTSADKRTRRRSAGNRRTSWRCGCRFSSAKQLLAEEEFFMAYATLTQFKQLANKATSTANEDAAITLYLAAATENIDRALNVYAGGGV